MITPDVCPNNVLIKVPSAVFQSLMVLSPLPETTYLESHEKLAEFTFFLKKF
jgi:hypothetical protein